MDLEDIIKRRCSEFKTLTDKMCYEIVLCAPALSIKECLDRCMLEDGDLSAEEMNFVERCHRRGRANGVKDACDNLFMHMKTRNGGQSAIEYLSKVSTDFGMTAQKTSSGGFAFNIVLPPEEQNP